jgi:hypothetical protein
MKFMLLVYTDTAMLNALPDGELDGMLRTCFDHADELQQEGRLIGRRCSTPRTPPNRSASGTDA